MDWNISWEMAEKWSQITHILEREDMEFEEAMSGQVGTIFSSANGLSNMGSFENVNWYWYYHPVYQKKEITILAMPLSTWH